MFESYDPYDRLEELEACYLQLSQHNEQTTFLLKQQSRNIQKLSEAVVNLMCIVQELETRLEENAK